MDNTNEALKALDEIEIAIEQLCKLTNRKFKDTLGYQRIETIRAALTANTLPTSSANVSSALAALDKAGKWMSAAQECQFTCRECKGDFLEALDAIEAIRAAYHNSANGGE